MDINSLLVGLSIGVLLALLLAVGRVRKAAEKLTRSNWSRKKSQEKPPRQADKTPLALEVEEEAEAPVHHTAVRAGESMEVSEVNPLEGVDIYIRYGHLDRAADILRWYVDNLGKDDVRAQSKLLQIYLRMGQRENYNLLLTRMVHAGRTPILDEGIEFPNEAEEIHAPPMTGEDMSAEAPGSNQEQEIPILAASPEDLLDFPGMPQPGIVPPEETPAHPPEPEAPPQAPGGIHDPDLLKQMLDHQSPSPISQIGEDLIAHGLVKEEHLQKALQIQKRYGAIKPRIGEILVSTGLVDQKDLNFILAKRLGVPAVDLRNLRIPQSVVGLVPMELCQRFTLMPCLIHRNQIVVAMQDPMDQNALKALRFACERHILAVMAPKDDIEWAINEYYQKGSEPWV
ncbi:MAG: hypothetical protein HKL98_13120 [Burkholderiales bacterium]|nr:hypothetical protein [Burkholderiales bacterium]